MRLTHRLGIALSAGLVAGLLCMARLVAPTQQAGDFSWALNGARALLAHQNPYHVQVAPDPAINTDPLYYPLPAVLVAIPFTPLPDRLAGGIFVMLSAGLLAFGITRDGPHWLPILFSMPFLFAAIIAQWSIFVVACALTPVISGLSAVKPTLGLSLWCWRPSRATIIGGATILLVSLIILPSWPWDWIANLRRSHHSPPLLMLPLGPLLLLAIIRLRDARARLLLALACQPQLLWFYDQLPLLLIARTWRESMKLAMLTWIGMPLAIFVPWLLNATPATGPYIVAAIVLATTYLPACILVLWPANHNITGMSDTSEPFLIEPLR